jgi:hypothetical protein
MALFKSFVDDFLNGSVSDCLIGLLPDLVPWVVEFNREYVNPTFPDLEPSILKTGDQTV